MAERPQVPFMLAIVEAIAAGSLIQHGSWLALVLNLLTAWAVGWFLYGSAWLARLCWASGRRLGSLRAEGFFVVGSLEAAVILLTSLAMTVSAFAKWQHGNREGALSTAAIFVALVFFLRYVNRGERHQLAALLEIGWRDGLQLLALTALGVLMVVMWFAGGAWGIGASAIGVAAVLWLAHRRLSGTEAPAEHAD